MSCPPEYGWAVDNFWGIRFTEGRDPGLRWPGRSLPRGDDSRRKNQPDPTRLPAKALVTREGEYAN
ncbi:hypothetical protein GCM10010305_01460 [Streptomyces termitum]|uniref:Uncharacterized protein n=1 Tax=Streptomyces termitum TaxID=67368 RepID=A0A918W246_9ACTN|nr:hypothetical protein GCM10010305_01460 [Streptomyces termitum]